MNSTYWRYLLLLCLLYIFWGEFFIAGGVLNQLAINFALFYPLGFLVGYRHRYENLRIAYLTAVIFNLFSYVLAYVEKIRIESWIIVVIDFVSLFMILRVGAYIGQRAQTKE